jgi:hypothetical protein
MENKAMQNVSYNFQPRRKEKELESSLCQIYSNLDSLGNNLMGMLWMVHLTLAALEKLPDVDQEKKNLQDAMRAGNCAKNLMRLILNSRNPKLAGTSVLKPQSGPRAKRFKI